MVMYGPQSLDDPGLKRPEQAEDAEGVLDRLAQGEAPDVRALAELLSASPRVPLRGAGRLAALADGLRLVAMAELASEYVAARSPGERSLARAAFSSLAKGTPHVVWTTSAGAIVKVSAGGRYPRRVAHMLKRSVAAMMGLSIS